MKTYSCVVTIAIEDEDDKFANPGKWDWDALIGEGIKSITVFDVTDKPVNQVRLTDNGVSDYCEEADNAPR